MLANSLLQPVAVEVAAVAARLVIASHATLHKKQHANSSTASLSRGKTALMVCRYVSGQ